MAINYVRSWSAPSGTTTTELAAAAPEAAGVLCPRLPPRHDRQRRPPETGQATTKHSLQSAIRSSAKSIRQNVGKLKVLCTYDTGQYTSFETGPIMVNNALIGTTEHDIFSLDPTNCHENWRTHEDYKPASLLAVNRGAAYMDGLLFRGTEDGRVLAYDFKTGKRVWETTIADPKIGESTPAAPIAWNGLVFIGNAGGDNKGVKGRMYALDAKTGKIVWEFYLVPKTEGDPTRGPQGATPLDMSTWKNASGTPITGGANLDLLHFGSDHWGIVYPRRQSGARLRNRPTRGRESLFRLRCRTRRQDRSLQKPFQACAQGLARLGRLHRACPDSDKGRQKAAVGRAQGWTPLWLRSRHQHHALSHANDADRECRRAFRHRQGRPFLPRHGRRGGMERSRLRSANQPHPDRRSRLVRDGDAAE